MFCVECGNKLDDVSKFCPNCGTKKVGPKNSTSSSKKVKSYQDTSESAPLDTTKREVGPTKGKLKTIAKLGLLFVICALIFLALINHSYNKLVNLRQTCNQAWSDMEYQLNQKNKLVSQFVIVVKDNATNDKGFLDEVLNVSNVSRLTDTVQEQAKGQELISEALGELLERAETYRDINGNEDFQRLKNQLSENEHQIAAASRFYNNAVLEYNSQIDSFPAFLVANVFNFTPRESFESINEDNQK